MTVPPELARAVADALGAEVAGGNPVSGGDLNDAWRIELGDGRTVFVKTAVDAPGGGYATEAAGLRWLAEPEALVVPGVLAVSDRLLALEWIEEGRLEAAGEAALGRGLAALHAAGAPCLAASTEEAIETSRTARARQGRCASVRWSCRTDQPETGSSCTPSTGCDRWRGGRPSWERCPTGPRR